MIPFYIPQSGTGREPANIWEIFRAIKNKAITFTFQLNKGERSAFRSKLINAWSFPELS